MKTTSELLRAARSRARARRREERAFEAARQERAERFAYVGAAGFVGWMGVPTTLVENMNANGQDWDQHEYDTCRAAGMGADDVRWGQS